MNKTTCNQNSTQRTKQYIVDAPEPIDGQIPSSGGLRKNGKIAAQYKNPREYKAPVYPSTPIRPSHADIAREQFQRTVAEFGTELFWSVNDNLIQPLAEDWFKRVTLRIKSFFDDLTATPRYKEIIDADNLKNDSQKEDNSDKDNVIKFPKERAS